jgi:hypothetical protein
LDISAAGVFRNIKQFELPSYVRACRETLHRIAAQHSIEILVWSVDLDHERASIFHHIHVRGWSTAPSSSLLCSVKMNRAESTRSQQIRCDGCTQITASYDIVNYGSMEGGYRQLCGQCFNKEVAELEGIAGFENAKVEPVGLVDSVGAVHEFHFRARLFGPGIALDAFELRDEHPAGYQFQIIGDPKEDLLVLLGRLIEKMRRALSIKHLADGEH